MNYIKQDITVMFNTVYCTEMKVISFKKFREYFKLSTPTSVYLKKLTEHRDYITQDDDVFIPLTVAIALGNNSRVEDKDDLIQTLTEEVYSTKTNLAAAIIADVENNLYEVFSAFVDASTEINQNLGKGIARSLNRAYNSANYSSEDDIVEPEQVMITEPEFPEDKYPQEPIIHTEEETDYDL